MPLYIVRWPNLSAAIVCAEDEDHLLDILDEEGNAEGCRIEEYDGPLFIDFELPVKLEVTRPAGRVGPISPEQIAVENVDELLSKGMTVTAGNCDTGFDMCEAVMRFAFPNVYREWSKDEGERTAPDLAKAAREDALDLVRADWRWEQTKRAGDPASALAAVMDMPVKVARRYLPPAPEDVPSPPPEGPRGRKR